MTEQTPKQIPLDEALEAVTTTLMLLNDLPVPGRVASRVGVTLEVLNDVRAMLKTEIDKAAQQAAPSGPVSGAANGKMVDTP